MRTSQKSNRQRGRGRGNKPSGNVANRVFDSAGPEGKVRGTPQQIIDKYLALARDAQTSGDRVVAENFLQHAEHYQRMLIAAQAAQQPERRDSDEGQQQSSQGGADRDDDDRDDGQSKPQQERARAGGGMDMIEPDDGSAGSALVETPENSETRRMNGNGADGAPGDGGGKPKRRRRPRNGDSSPEAEASSD